MQRPALLSQFRFDGEQVALNGLDEEGFVTFQNDHLFDRFALNDIAQGQRLWRNRNFGCDVCHQLERDCRKIAIVRMNH